MNLAASAARTILRLRNRLDFGLRQILRIHRAVQTVRADDLTVTLALLKPTDLARANDLIRRFGLGPPLAMMRSRDQRELLAYADVLDDIGHRVPLTLPTEGVTALDIGASHWMYASALDGFLAHWDSPVRRRVRLTGIEIDPWRLFGDGHTRHDWAEWYTRQLPDSTYLHGDARSLTQRFDIITMLFPFVAIGEIDRWGLPESTFDPMELTKHAWSLLAPGGHLVIVNQGRIEAGVQRSILNALGTDSIELPPFRSAFFGYRHPRVAFVARRVS